MISLLRIINRIQQLKHHFQIKNMEREIDFKKINSNISNHLQLIQYIGDLSDIGNEIGIAIGNSLENMNSDELDLFITGFKHGVSLTNGTH